MKKHGYGGPPIGARAPRRPLLLWTLALLGLLLVACAPVQQASEAGGALPARPGDQTVELPDVNAHYTISIEEFDLDAGSLLVDQQIDVQSNEGPLDRLLFTVVPAYYGYFELRELSVTGVPVEPRALNDGYTLEVPLPPGQSWRIRFRYQLDLEQVPPESWHAVGMDGDIIRLGHWFPLISDDHPFPGTTDPLYARVASFDVHLTLPEGVPFAHTGERVVADPLPGGRVRYELRAERVREFALVVAPGFEIERTTSRGGVEIELYCPPETSPQLRSEALEAAALALDRFSELIGPYPYDQFRMAHIGTRMPGGIEFPILVYLNLEIAGLQYLIYHEVAHQWFYGVIGTRTHLDPWIDEGAATFLESGLESDFADRPEPPAAGYPAPLDVTEAELLRENLPGYETVYLQGQQLFYAVLDEMGEEAFWAALREIYVEYQFDIVTAWDMLLTWQRHSATDLRPLYRDYFRYPWIDDLPPPGAVSQG